MPSKFRKSLGKVVIRTMQMLLLQYSMINYTLNWSQKDDHLSDIQNHPAKDHMANVLDIGYQAVTAAMKVHTRVSDTAGMEVTKEEIILLPIATNATATKTFT